MTAESTEFRRKLTSYGRRKGKTLRAHHRQLMDHELPRLQINPDFARRTPLDLFDKPFDEVWLEVGFGGGEHLACDALRHPHIAFIGCELFQNGVAKLLALIEERGIENVRVYPGDARELMSELPDACLGRVNILYPDPWPKTRQKKRRFVNEETLRMLARVMRPGSELRFATDIDDYSAWTLGRILRSPYFDWRATSDRDWLTPWEGWPGTRFEEKALREGRKPIYCSFLRNRASVTTQDASDASQDLP